MVPKSQAEVSVVRQRLIRAGYRTDSAIKIFYGAKVLVHSCSALSWLPVALPTSTPSLRMSLHWESAFWFPDFWLGRRITLRQKQIRLGLPEVLDFLIICVEAGLSMDQATARTAQELRMSQPAISDELDIVVLEQRAGRARSDAWKEFAERTAVDNVRRLVSVLVQSEQLGTSVAKTLRIHSDTLRTQRRQESRRESGEDHRQTGLSTRLFYLSLSVPGHPGPGGNFNCQRVFRRTLHISKKGEPIWTM